MADLARATAGTLRRAGFFVSPPDTPNSATTGFEVMCHHVEGAALDEHNEAVARGDAFPPT